MPNFRLSRALCAVVGSVLSGSHQTLNALFVSSGVPGEPPDLSHATKWKEWLFRAGSDPNTNSLAVLGNILEEFMDRAPTDDPEALAAWKINREKVIKALEENELRYYRGGRIVPTGQPESTSASLASSPSDALSKPRQISEALDILLKGLPRAMHPLTHRRKGAVALSFDTEYDVQDLLHALLRPWVSDIRPEEFTPSYAGTSTRMDFLLPKYGIVIELKFVRDRTHARKIGDELIIDIEHYRQHPDCSSLLCVIFDRDHLLTNAAGLKNDLEGERVKANQRVHVTLHVVNG